jgi:hypothetical protein
LQRIKALLWFVGCIARRFDMSITLEQAKALKYGDVLYHRDQRYSRSNTPVEWKVNGKPKVWKTRPDEVRVPVKYGMYSYDYLTEQDLDLVALDPKEVQEG